MLKPWIRWILFFSAVSVVLAASLLRVTVAQADPAERLVLAFYYTRPSLRLRGRARRSHQHPPRNLSRRAGVIYWSNGISQVTGTLKVPVT